MRPAAANRDDGEASSRRKPAAPAGKKADLQKQQGPTVRFALALETRHKLIFFWAVLIGCVVIGSLLHASSPVLMAVSRLQISDKLLHFCAYLLLSSLPVVGFQDHRRGLVAGLSMFLLGLILEAGQHYFPGRAVEFGDVIANGAGVGCGLLLAFRLRTFTVPNW